LAEKLKPVPISAIFTSPLGRAVETTKILSQTLGLPYQITDALREYDCGILEGKSDPES
jgi:broad specificity phosphatase PhoE